MKILFVINALTLGGAQTFLVDLANRCKETGNEVIIATFRDGILSSKLQELDIDVKILGESCFDLIAFYRLVKLLKSFKPDIVHSHLFRATAWTRLAKFFCNIKLITSIHGAESKIYHFVEKIMQPLSDYTIFPSNYLAKWYFDSIKPIYDNSYKVVYPGVFIKKTRIYKQQKNIVLGSLSRLHQVKGIDTILKAAKILFDKNINFVLNIGGNGKEKEKDRLTKLTENLGVEKICHFVYDIPDKKDYLENLSIFVAPSRSEAFGINICEAMERSLPVVSTDVGGIPEIIDNNETGILCETDNAKDLADNLEKLINNFELRKNLGNNGRKKVEELFDREIAIKEHIDLYKSMIENNKKIHFVISSCELGGGERLAINLIKNLQKRGWKITATCAGNPLYSELLSLNVKCSVASMNLGGTLFAIKLLKDLITYKPRIISSHLNKASLFSGLLSKLTGIKCVSHIHGLNKKIYYQFSDKQIAVSNAVRQHLIEQKADSSTLVTINNCIDKPAVGTRSFPERPLNISITAKLHENKGHKWALKAISENIEGLNIGKIHIFGDGPERNNLKNLCDSLIGIKDKIVFHGFVNDPSQYYDNTDVALLPSLGEGIPLSLLEVMRLGIPCIATNVGGIPEIIENNKSGLLIEPKNNKELIEAINKLSDKNNYEYFSKQAFERFKTVNNQEKMIDDFEAILLNLMNE